MLVNIYLSQETKEKLKEISNRFKVSISTITDVIINQNGLIGHYLNMTKGKAFTDYIDKQDLIKTSIKPKGKTEKIFNYFNETEKPRSKSDIGRLISNILYSYIKKDYVMLTNKENITKLKQDIGNELAKRKEQYWNYNTTIRQNIRFYKENKDYLERISKK